VTDDSNRRIEHEIVELLHGEMRDTALEFTAYLDAKQLSPRPWFGPGYWRIPYGAYYLCGLVVNEHRWRVWFFTGDYSGAFPAGFIHAVHDAVKRCGECSGDCPGGKTALIFGQEFADACFQFPIQFENPADSTVDVIKALLAYWQEAAPRSASWHAR